MITLPRLCLAFLLCLTLTACERSATETPLESNRPEAGEAERTSVIGAAAAKALIASLGGQLKGAMESGGPVAAIGVCRQVALPLTAATGESFEGVTIRRTTLKPRNPANAPDPTDRRVLELMSTQSSPRAVVRREGEIIRYYEPLFIQEICLKCHGDAGTFPKDLVDVLTVSYPGDRATGYALGELRGVIRVDIVAP